MIGSGYFLRSFSEKEKTAFIGAVASLATADRVGSEEEIQHIKLLCDAAGLSTENRNAIINVSMTLDGEALRGFLDRLKSSELKFALLTDLLEFARRDPSYSEKQQHQIRKVCDYLRISDQQLSTLVHITEKVYAQSLTLSPESYLRSLGVSQEIQKSGVPVDGLMEGLVGFAAPAIIGGLFCKETTLPRYNGDILHGKGLGSLIGMLSGGRSMASAASLIGRITA